jgi:hypothetical protein
LASRSSLESRVAPAITIALFLMKVLLDSGIIFILLVREYF